VRSNFRLPPRDASNGSSTHCLRGSTASASNRVSRETLRTGTLCPRCGCARRNPDAHERRRILVPAAAQSDVQKGGHRSQVSPTLEGGPIRLPIAPMSPQPAGGDTGQSSPYRCRIAGDYPAGIRRTPRFRRHRHAQPDARSIRSALRRRQSLSTAPTMNDRLSPAHGSADQGSNRIAPQ